MGLAPFRPPNYAELDVTDKPAWVQALDWTANEQSSTDQFRIDQLESLQAVDRGVGEIMQALRDIGEDDNTLVIFTGTTPSPGARTAGSRRRARTKSACTCP
jgi:arylsulfatase A-like enzyme